MSMSEQLQSRCQGLQCSLSRDKCPPLSSTTTILVQAAITLSLDKHEMPLAVFPTSSSSFPIHCPQSVQSKHLKTENRSRLSPTSAPLTLCLSPYFSSFNALPESSGRRLRADAQALLWPRSLLQPAPCTLSCHPHTSATLNSFYSLECTDPSAPQRFCTPRFLCLETNTPEMHLPHIAHTWLATCRSKLICHTTPD